MLIPYVVAAPFYFAGKVTLGGLNQIGAAFNQVNESLNFFVTYYVSLADFKATLDRLTSFDQSIARARALDTREPRIEAMSTDSPDLEDPRPRGQPSRREPARAGRRSHLRGQTAGAPGRPLRLRQVDPLPRRRGHLAVRRGEHRPARGRG